MRVTDCFRGGLVAVVLTTATLAAAPALAQDSSVPSGDSVTVAVAAVQLNDYEGSDHYNTTPAPAVVGSVGGYAFQLIGNRVSVDLIRNNPGPVWDIQAGPTVLVNMNRSGTDGIDDVRVRALGKRSTAIEAGGFVGIGKTGVLTSPYDKLSFSISYRHDLGSVHKSATVTPSISYLTPLSRKAAAGIFVSADHVGARYGQTYFGVDAAGAAASGFPVYSPRAGWKSYTIGGGAGYALTGDLLHGWKIGAGGFYKRMTGDYADSPLVAIAGSKTQWLGAIGIGYTF